MAREGDDFQTLVPDAVRACQPFLHMTADDVVAGGIGIHHVGKDFLDA